MEDVRLEFREDALRAIARKAIDRKTGARGLRPIMESILLDPMYDLPSLEGVEEIIIKGDVVNQGAKPIMVHAERRDDVSTGACAYGLDWHRAGRQTGVVRRVHTP